MEIDLKLMKVGYVNLEDFPNRNQTMINMLNRLGLDYFRVEGETSLEYDAISSAHVKALDSGADLILEDDCLPTAYYRDTFDIPDDADVVYLGISTGTTGTHSPKYEKVSDEIYKLNDMTSAHAILYITRAGRNWLKAARDLTVGEGIGFDMATAKLMPTIKAYGLNRPIWYQYDVPSQTNLTLDEAVLVEEYSGGDFSDYPEPLQ
jgi:hypothetical protein